LNSNKSLKILIKKILN